MSFTATKKGRIAAVKPQSGPEHIDMITVTKIAPKAQPEHGTIHWLNECIERGKREIFAETVMLNPGLAAELIRRNPDNRGIRVTKATQFATDIRGGRWVLNGEPIIISKEGLLNDGQHRVMAVVEANISIPVVVMFGLDRETRVTVDQGSARSAGDYLTMQGVHNATVQAAIARMLLAYERNDSTGLRGIAFITNAETLARVHADDAILKSAALAANHAKKTQPFAAPAVIGFCHYVFNDINPAQADEYMGQIVRGEGLKAKDPAYTVRERLLSFASKSREQRIHVIFRGWNAYRQGRSLTMAKIVGDENIPAAL